MEEYFEPGPEELTYMPLHRASGVRGSFVLPPARLALSTLTELRSCRRALSAVRLPECTLRRQIDLG